MDGRFFYTDSLGGRAGPPCGEDQARSIAPSSLFGSDPESTASYPYPLTPHSRHALVLAALALPRIEPPYHVPSLGAEVESSRWSADNMNVSSQPLPHLQPAHMTDFSSFSAGGLQDYAVPLPVGSTSASLGTGNSAPRDRLPQPPANDEVRPDGKAVNKSAH